MNPLSETAAAVLEALNTGTYSREFVATRVYLPQFRLEDLGELTVVVAARGVEEEFATRTTIRGRYQIDVAVMQRLESVDDLDVIDGLMDLLFELADSLFGRRLTVGAGSAICVERSAEPVYSVAHLEQFNQFTARVTLTWDMTR